MKRILAILAFALFAVAFAFALDGNVTWFWFENDYNVEYYRYQLDGENEDGWVVVDWSVTEVTLSVDISVPHTLYLQQSYDGENWSESSLADSEVYQEEGVDASPIDEVNEEFAAAMEAEYGDSFVAVGPTSVNDADMVVYDTISIDRYNGMSCLDFGVGYLNYLPNSTGPKSVGLFVSYNRTYVQVGFGEFGFKANLSLYTNKNLFVDIRHTQLMSYANMLAMFMTKVGNCDLFGAIGPDFRFTMFTDAKAKLGLAAELGIRFHRSKDLVIGMSLSDHYYLIPNTDMANAFDVRLFMTKTF